MILPIPCPIRVLLIDDDDLDRRVARRLLSEIDLDVTIVEVSDPTEAGARARSGEFDCILMDFAYPAGTAFEHFSDLLSERCTNRPPIVMLTGSGDERIAAECIQRGAQEYLTKAGLSAAALRLAIEGALLTALHERELVRRDEELKRMSFSDALTELPNRRLFLDRLEQATRDSARTATPFAVLMMDLNLFKDVNDGYGHDVGDELLRQVAERLRRSMRDSDTVARLGGDEFAAVLSTANSLEGAMVVADKITEAVAEPFVLGKHVAYVGMSVGVALSPEHGRTADTLLHRADAALYESKRTGRGVTVYGPESLGPGREAALIATGLKGALQQDELFAVYQPQVRLSDGAVVGMEALVRWRHPQLGLVPATRFVPAAERSEVIEGLTHRVLRLSLAQAACWAERESGLRVSVNLSARLLDRAGVVERLADLVDDADVDPRSVCFEVTESGLMHAPEAAEHTLSALSERGFQLSIDDFGTGYSSLKYLRNFPIDEIKIDELFVGGLTSDDRDGSIVESILALGRAFDVRVLAEGIESDATWEALTALGCGYGQGYRFGRPMTGLEVDRWLGRWRDLPPARRAADTA